MEGKNSKVNDKFARKSSKLQHVPS